MATMTEQEWQHLYENLETTWLLQSLDAIDRLALQTYPSEMYALCYKQDRGICLC